MEVNNGLKYKEDSEGRLKNISEVQLNKELKKT